VLFGKPSFLKGGISVFVCIQFRHDVLLEAYFGPNSSAEKNVG
jgi:hypothetical protein